MFCGFFFQLEDIYFTELVPRCLVKYEIYGEGKGAYFTKL